MNANEKGKDYVNANDKFKDHRCSERLYRHWMGMLYTDGVQTLCDEFKCKWLLDSIMVCQWEIKNEPYRFWRLERTKKNSAILTCDDGNGKIIKTKKIGLTDIKANEVTIWLFGNLALLPSEY